MTALEDCLASLITTIDLESAALERQDHAAAAALLQAKTTLSATLQHHASTFPTSRQTCTPALVSRLNQSIAANRSQLERAIRIRRHMLDLLRQTARRSMATSLYSLPGRDRPTSNVGAAAFVTRA